MPESTEELAYQNLLHCAREWALLQSCSHLLGWDQQTLMPRGGAWLRGEQSALLAGLLHDRLLDPRQEDGLACLESSGWLAEQDDWTQANVREWGAQVRRARSLPRDLVEALARATTAAQEAWVAARAAADFEQFEPHLTTIVRLKREEAAALQAGRPGAFAEPYDALLDEYEPGMTAVALEPLFARLVTVLSGWVQAVAQSGISLRGDYLTREYPIERQRWFAESAAAAIGFELTQGRLDVATHPFCSGIGPGDCRLTTRYQSRYFPDGFFGTLHEAGHGLYEQNLPRERFGQPAATSASLGIHESQSRLWENMIGRSEAFWRAWWPRLRQAFPGTLADAQEHDFVLALNAVQPSFIRVEADEVSYNLHIALRFELERALLNGDCAVADLPAAWNDRFVALFGLKVPNDRQGCLQDIHWSFGGLGYFPTYTLGNLYAAQWLSKARADLGDLDAALRQGDALPLTDWLKQNIHQAGRRDRAETLCRKVTGQTLSPEPFLSYLREKLSRTYGVC